MLMKLSMANNSISGKLPRELGDFKSLEYLDISNNLFSGGIPEEIGKLRSLQNLSLAGNSFSGRLPISIGELVSLRSLDLSRNNLSGPLTSRLTDLKSLVSLNLSSNSFSRRIITGLEEIRTLEELDLSWNHLEGGIEWTFLIESNAVHVDLSGNSLISLGPTEMKFLSDVAGSLRYLNLSYNQLKGSLINGEGGISTFGSLRVLDLSHNRLSGELPGFDYVYNLEVLRLGNNGFSGFVPGGLLEEDSLVLSELDLSSNNLSGHIGMITSTTLQYLNLSSNSITGELPLLTGAARCWISPATASRGTCPPWPSGGTASSSSTSAGTNWRAPSPGDIPVPPVKPSQPLPQRSLRSSAPYLAALYSKLTVLDLSFNRFAGAVTVELLLSATLEELRLQENLLEGGISFSQSGSSEKRRSGLLVLDLSGNRLNGSLGVGGFRSFAGLQVLDVARNRFSGHLPAALSELISLTSLDISGNQFTGRLPETLPDMLVSFNASYNDLSGVVPENLRKFPESSFRPGNARLLFPGVPAGHGGASPGGSSSSHRPVRAVVKLAAILASVAVVMILILAVVVVSCRRISRSSPSEEASGKAFKGAAAAGSGAKKGGGASSEALSVDEKAVTVAAAAGTATSAGTGGFSPTKPSRFSWSPESGESYLAEHRGKMDNMHSPGRLAGDLHFLDDAIALTAEQLSRAPAEVLGRSSHGTSYKATLDNGILLTPKRDFAREAKKFANIRHPNVVPLRGYYWAPPSTRNSSSPTSSPPAASPPSSTVSAGRRGPPLTWVQRLRIAVDVARGMNYLHFDRTAPHGNLKATNILLDGLELNARVADYCLHRLMTAAGTVEQVLDSGVLGYRAPELAAARKPSPSFKSDVYAFGVVLLELLTGRCAGDVVSGEEGGVDLTDWVRLRVAGGRGSDCFDPFAVASDTQAAKGMKEVLGLALRCLRPRPSARASSPSTRISPPSD
ncbi:unnamed protein product [Spirodela intermedia]|uniref:Protein kinase domain-containing protein n=1 Tax=Spirodela intermedia TaxID=51605 RepID=A0A7I8JWH7_SPIIN|nr:unnamed protein product [Spirodela intermedia]CAA2634859.1 unnamed protein product [Spirodela intermedia]CAA6668547.1 unnamed protein product [Spirodela intermedia]CAA6673832.1 unnamed protein product [Spirodela intermedia]